MRKSRFTEEQIIGIVREHEAGAKLDELCRRHNVSPTTFHKWRAKYAGVNVSEAKRLRALEEENLRLKQLLADAMLDNQALKGLLAKTGDACGATAGGGGRPRGASAVAPAGLQAGRDLALAGGASAKTHPKSGASARAASRPRRRAAAVRLSAAARAAAPRGLAGEPQARRAAVSRGEAGHPPPWPAEAQGWRDGGSLVPDRRQPAALVGRSTSPRMASPAGASSAPPT